MTTEMTYTIVSIFTVMGLLGMTWLYPLIARLIFPKSKTESADNDTKIKKLSILIPTYNESATLKITIGQIQKSIIKAKLNYPSTEFKVVVGLDGCTDESKDIISELTVDSIQNTNNLGKWKTLLKLIQKEANQTDWIVLADTGIMWGPGVLTSLLDQMKDGQLIGIAPSYRNPNGGSSENILWNIEKHFKSIESHAGGPVSVHGATVAYRSKELLAAIQTLDAHSPKKDWLNDDVVIPLMMRTLFPTKKIKYLSEVFVCDHEQVSQPKKERNRRFRMLAGNIQWIQVLLPIVFQQNKIAGILALRRVFRLLWAYWGIGIVVMSAAFIFQMPPILYIPVVAILTIVLLSKQIRAKLHSLTSSAIASLMAPLYLTKVISFGKVGWK